jgi:hypothetical protein
MILESAKPIELAEKEEISCNPHIKDNFQFAQIIFSCLLNDCTLGPGLQVGKNDVMMFGVWMVIWCI